MASTLSLSDRPSELCMEVFSGFSAAAIPNSFGPSDSKCWENMLFFDCVQLFDKLASFLKNNLKEKSILSSVHCNLAVNNINHTVVMFYTQEHFIHQL